MENNQLSSNFTPFEPKKRNRFFVKFGEPFNISKDMIKATTRPSFTIIDGEYKWDDMIFELFDPIEPSTSYLIMDGFMKLKQKIDSSIDVSIQLLNPIGNVIEEWKVFGSISYVNFGELDWGKSESLIVKIYLKVDNAIILF